jgi:hypothetical protein
MVEHLTTKSEIKASNPARRINVEKIIKLTSFKIFVWSKSGPNITKLYAVHHSRMFVIS